MGPRRWFLALLVLPLTLATAADPTEQEKPLPAELEEKVEKRLVQLDVSVEGEGADLYELTARDFELFVGSREIAEFTVDRLCPGPGPGPGREAAGPARDAAAPLGGTPPAKATTSFVFFFDQPHLTVQGRALGLDTARDLVKRLVRDGSRGMIVSIARDMRTIVPLTEDPGKLLQALDRLEKDLSQWDPYAAQEESRIREVLEALRDSRERARALARAYKREEWWQAYRSLDRMGMLVGSLLEVKAPKVLFYFADTLRQRAGLHYCNLVGGCDPGEDLTPEAAFEFDRAIDAAAKVGLHVYPVQAEGLPAEGGDRVSHAEEGLQVLAAETGGEAMIRGISPARFAQRVLARLSCVYLLSFDPGALPTDKPLPITVKVKRSGVKVHVQGRLVVQSEAERRTSRLLAAFAAPTLKGSDFPVGIELIPLGFEKKRYRALVQVKVPGAGSGGGETDLGASLLSSGKVREDFSARLKVGAAGVPVVLEKEVELEPGPFEVVAVGHRMERDEIGTGRAEGSWPDPRGAEATVSPIVLLQEATAAFSRGGAVRTSGALALSGGEPARRDRSTALVAVVCRNVKIKSPLLVERVLSGETELTFEPLDLGEAPEPCVQIRDVIPPGTLGPGGFRYELRVRAGRDTLAEGAREFVAGAPPEPSSPGARRWNLSGGVRPWVPLLL